MQDNDDPLVPPPTLLFDGSTSPEQFIAVGDGFTNEYLIHRAHLLPHERVLDLGSGNGQKTRALARHLNQDGSYEGLDIVRSGVEWCQKAYAHLPHFQFTLAEDLYSSHYNPKGRTLARDYCFPYNTREFDLVFCSSLMTHLLPEETLNYLREIGRVLKPQGRCVISAFLLNDDSEPFAAVGQIKFPVEREGYRLANAETPAEAVAIPERFVRGALMGAGFRVCEITFGTWYSAPELLGALQDVLIAVKR